MYKFLKNDFLKMQVSWNTADFSWPLDFLFALSIDEMCQKHIKHIFFSASETWLIKNYFFQNLEQKVR